MEARRQLGIGVQEDMNRYASWVIVINAKREPIVKRCDSQEFERVMMRQARHLHPDATIICAQTNPADRNELWACSEAHWQASTPLSGWADNSVELSTNMKLDRNITNPRRGKYALIKLRDAIIRPPNVQLGTTEVSTSAIDFGDTEDSDFFVIRLKDKFAGPALRGYASAITAHLATLPPDDPSRGELVEYHHEIIALAEEAAANPNQGIPN